MKIQTIIMIFLAIAALMSVSIITPASAQAGVLPDMAAEAADELDAQLARRMGQFTRPMQNMTLMVTTPVNLNNLETSSPLARLLAEELATWFVSMGYNVQELRKGKAILFAPQMGEMMLTRRANLLDQRNMQGAIILTGTYVVTSRTVRFNLRFMEAANNNVIAMTSCSIPVGRETLDLLTESPNFTSVRPSVATRIKPSAY